MIGVYELVCVITLEDLSTPALELSGLFLSSVVVGGWTVTVMVSSGGSLGACTCYVGVLWLMSRLMLISGMPG